MKTLPCPALTLTLALALLGATAAHSQSFLMSRFGRGQGDSRTILVLKADGTCGLTNETILPRTVLEMQVTVWERAQKDEQTDADEASPSAAPAAEAKSKSLTDTELAAKVRSMFGEAADPDGDGSGALECVEVVSNSVRLVTSSTFGSLKDLFSQRPYVWGPQVLMPESARLELDTNRNVRFTFSGSAARGGMARSMVRAWKLSKTKYEWKLVFPGKVLSSALPATEGSATWITIDSDKAETLEAAQKLLDSPVVITAAANGLKLEEPLDSKQLVTDSWNHRGSGPELPITDAGPGFTAEPVSISLTTLYRFPESEAYLKDRSAAARLSGMNATGTVVTAKLFPPKGRQIRTVSEVRVKAAKDDQGRPVVPAAQGGDEGMGTRSYAHFSSFSSGDEEKSGSARVELRLGLPAGDAKAIDELQAEAVVLSIGSWKELVLTNVQADAKKELNLDEVLPGARLVVQKISGKHGQRKVEATLTGPPAVQGLEVEVKLAGRNGQSNSYDRRNQTAGGKTTRSLTIQSYEFNQDGDAKTGPLSLRVRSPQDLKRERVQFKLTALDLL